MQSTGVANNTETNASSGRHVKMNVVSALPSELQFEEEMARRFTARLHWELSTALTTNHLLSLISMAHTMMSMGNGVTFASSSSFASDSNRRKLIRKLSRQGSASGSGPVQPPTSIGYDEAELKKAEQVKESWNLFASLHCRLLPDLLARSSEEFKQPLVEILARRWQDRCIEIRVAAQSLLLAELRLAGSKGRRAIVEEWSPFLPTYTDNQMDHHQGHHGSMSSQTGGPGGAGAGSVSRSAPTAIPGGSVPHHQSQTPSSMANSPMPSPMSDSSHHLPGEGHGHGHSHHTNNMDSDGEADDDEENLDELTAQTKANKAGGGGGGSSVGSEGSEGRRRQATAIILMGVIGFEYGSEITGGAAGGDGGSPAKQAPPRPAPPPRPPRPGEAAPAPGKSFLSIDLTFLTIIFFQQMEPCLMQHQHNS